MQKILSMEISIEIQMQIFLFKHYFPIIPIYQPIQTYEKMSDNHPEWSVEAAVYSLDFIRNFSTFKCSLKFIKIVNVKCQQDKNFQFPYHFYKRKINNFNTQVLNWSLGGFEFLVFLYFKLLFISGSVFLFQPKILKEKSFHLSLSKSSIYLFLANISPVDTC